MTGETAPTPLLQMRGITTRFPGVVANDHVDFDVRAGEVHALLGENGAGKSTLMRVLFGLQRADEGEVLLDGVPLRVHSPRDAIAAGIGMIHQHFMLVPTLTVAENVALGQGVNPFGTPRLGVVADRLMHLSAEYELGVHPDAKVWQLSVGERQRVEILKAMYHETRLLVLDEPTAVLTPQEVEQLLATLRRMADAGRGLVFISHKLHEVMSFADRITVMRDGVVAGEVRPAETTRQQLADLMVGRPVKLVPDRGARHTGEVVLSVRELHVLGDRGQAAVDGVSLDVHGGEVLGVAGVSGNGQRELAEAIAGLRPATTGAMTIGDEDCTTASPHQRRRCGLAYVPEERMRDGTIGAFSVWENLLLLDHGRPPFARCGLLQRGAIRRHARQLVAAFAVRTPGLDTPTRQLSGGNIQKLILAREVSSAQRLLVAAQPTRGVDIGAAEYIHARLMAARDAGLAVLVISEDLDEVLALSDRVAVMFAGRIAGVLDRAACTTSRLGMMMAGAGDPGP
jgi:general nucleoside transport system ATP-binding protein